MIGPFELIEPIGAGGMGAVWRGRHKESHAPVAIKLLLGQFARTGRYLEGFHQEVRATAGLDHPGIVTVYDYGVVSQEASAAYEDLHEGSLWLAMDYVEGGTLDDHFPTNWNELRSLLIQLLDALAHAHARKLVHRDLKPGNVLCSLSTGKGSYPQWVLTDFGIAHVRDPTVSERTADLNSISAGTPHFMAPEQLLSNWRDYGPWTDLYALGCMAFLLSSGILPFEGQTVMSIALKHVNDPVPTLRPSMAVPANFENWVGRLLSKEIGQRYQSCADAARDLLRLGEPVAQSQPGLSGPSQESSEETFAQIPTMTFTRLPELISLETPTALLDMTQLADSLEKDRKKTPTCTETLPAVSRATRATRVIEVPGTWARQERQSRQPLVSTGKGLFGLRQIPFVGRIEERDHIWEELRKTVQSGAPRAVLVNGPAGHGKSRLIDWIATRAEELGIVNSLRSFHSPILTALEGLPTTFLTFMGATGLNRSQLLARLVEVHRTRFGAENLKDDYLHSLVEWLNPTEGGNDQGVPTVLLESPLERYRLITTLLRTIAAERPLVLTIDDGQWGQESLGLAHHLLTIAEDANLSILLLISCRDEELDRRNAEREYIALLQEVEATSTLHLNPLSTAEQELLIHEILGLSPQLVKRLGTHTEGNPLFALQLIEDWVQRDRLIESPQGYQLSQEVEFPATIQALLLERLWDLCQKNGPDPACRAAEARPLEVLEIAAALGLDLDTQEWEAICSSRGLELSDSLLDELMVQGLLLARQGGYRFRLPSYRDAIEVASRQNGRWASINLSCAENITSGFPSGSCLAERKARHYLAGKHPDEALPLLWKAAEIRLRQSGYIQVLSLLELIEDAFDQLELQVEDPRRARAELLRAETLRYRGAMDPARLLLQKILDWPVELPTSTKANGYRVLASLENFSGNPKLSRELYTKAIALFEEIDDQLGLAKSLHGLGWIYFLFGDRERSRHCFMLGYNKSLEANDKVEAAWCLHGVAEGYLSEHEPTGAELAKEAIALFLTAGCRSGAGLALRTLGDFQRIRGEFDLARSTYREARHYAQSTGHVLSVLADALFGFCDIEEGLYDNAYRRFESLYRVPTTRLFPVFRATAPAGLLVVAAARADWTSFDLHLDELEAIAAPQTQLGLDLLNYLTHAAFLAKTHGDEERALRAKKIGNIFLMKPKELVNL